LPVERDASVIANALQVAAAFAAESDKAVINNVNLTVLPGYGTKDHGMITKATDGVIACILRDECSGPGGLEAGNFSSDDIKKMKLQLNKRVCTELDYIQDRGLVATLMNYNNKMMPLSRAQHVLSESKDKYPNYSGTAFKHVDSDLSTQYHMVIKLEHLEEALEMVFYKKGSLTVTLSEKFNHSALAIKMGVDAKMVIEVPSTGVGSGIPPFGEITFNLGFLNKIASAVRQRGKSPEVNVMLGGHLEPVYVYAGPDTFVAMPINPR
jgi:hypothetical protein